MYKKNNVSCKTSFSGKKNEKQLLNGSRDDILYNLGEVRFNCVRADDLNFYRVIVCKFHVVLNVHRIVLKSVPHVQHDYFSPFDQLNS